MSWKITHGYKLPRVKTIKQAHAWWRMLQNACASVALREVVNICADRGAFAADCFSLRKHLPDTISVPEKIQGKDAMEVAFDMSELSEFFSQSPFKPQLEITIFYGGQTLCLLHSRNEALEKAFLKHSGAIPYFYVTSTDKPDSISQRDWGKRGRDWNAALGKSGVPCENGFLLQSENPMKILFDARREKPQFKPVFERAKKHSVELLCREKFGNSQVSGSQIVNFVYSLTNEQKENKAKEIISFLPELKKMGGFEMFFLLNVVLYIF